MYLWAYNCVHLKSCEHLLWFLICRAKVLNCWSGWTLLFNLIHQSWGKDTRSNWRRMDTTLCWHLIVNHVIVIAVRSYSGELVSMAINAKVCFMYSLLRQNYVLINVYTAMYICKNICLFPLTVCEYNGNRAQGNMSWLCAQGNMSWLCWVLQESSKDISIIVSTKM